jgi:hypothetical protein
MARNKDLPQEDKPPSCINHSLCVSDNHISPGRYCLCKQASGVVGYLPPIMGRSAGSWFGSSGRWSGIVPFVSMAN